MVKEIVEAALEADDPDVEEFRRRHGREGLERAAEYAREYERGEVTHRIAAREEGWSELETATIIDALRGFVGEESFDE